MNNRLRTVFNRLRSMCTVPGGWRDSNTTLNLDYKHQRTTQMFCDAKKDND